MEYNLSWTSVGAQMCPRPGPDPIKLLFSFNLSYAEIKPITGALNGHVTIMIG